MNPQQTTKKSQWSGIIKKNSMIVKTCNETLQWIMKILQHLGHLMRRANSLEKTLMLGKIEGKRRRGQQRMKQLHSATESRDMNLSKLWEIIEDGSLECCSPWGHKELDTT